MYGLCMWRAGVCTECLLQYILFGVPPLEVVVRTGREAYLFRLGNHLRPVDDSHLFCYPPGLEQAFR